MGKDKAAELLRQTLSRLDGAYSPATIRAYRADCSDFINICSQRGEDAFPGSYSAVIDYINWLIAKGSKSASIRRAIAGIASIHHFNGLEDPTKHIDVKLAMRRMHRLLGRHQHQAYAITKEIIEKMLAATDDSLWGLRDRAMILISYETLCRRGEITTLLIEDIHYMPQKNSSSDRTASILLRRSKTDQDAQGRWLTLSDNATSALNEWLQAAGIDHGPIFRGIKRDGKLTENLAPGNVARIYKRVARQALLDEQIVQKISGHSTRVGRAQDLLHSGASLPVIMNKGRWSKPDTVMRYIEQVGNPL